MPGSFSGACPDIKVEQYEQYGIAIAQLSWQSDCQVRELIPATQLYPPTPTCATPVAGSGTGVQGEHFDNPDFTARKLTRSDATIAFTWATGTRGGQLRLGLGCARSGDGRGAVLGTLDRPDRASLHRGHHVLDGVR